MSLFYNRQQEKTITCGNLPHWTQQGKIHFVTFRLADSLPKERLEQIKKERQDWDSTHDKPYAEKEMLEYQRLFSTRVEDWLDAGSGGCILSHSQCAEIVAEALRYFDGQRYQLDYWVVMPNHVHVLLKPIEPYTLHEILHSWKSFTFGQFMMLQLHQGQLWQHESFDHIVRSEKQLKRFREYIIENHNKAGGKAIISKNIVA